MPCSKSMTLRARLTGLFIAVVAAIVLLFSSLVYFFANQNVFADFYKRLELRARLAARITLEDAAKGNTAFNELRNEYIETLPSEKQYFIRLNEQSQPDSGMQAVIPASLISDAVAKGSAVGRDGNTLYAGLYVPESWGKYVVVVSGRNDYGVQFLNNLQWLLIASFIIKALILGFVGFLFSRRILKPVLDFTSKAKDIGVHNLTVRLPEGSGQDEMGVLASTFNHMLDRLETSFESQKSFIGNASHELRTPLTSIMGEAEWALLKTRSAEEYQQSLQTIQKQAERLEEITRSLLSMARTGFDGGRQEMTRLRIDEKLLRAKELADAIYPNNRIRFDFSHLPEQEEQLQLWGNKDLLQSAFSNVLINACKYSDNNEVLVSLDVQSPNLIIRIADKGIGIPSKDLPYIFDPFFRASNVSGYMGYGIGLPLARNIIRLHHGEITVESVEGKGTSITIVLPQLMYSAKPD